MTGRPHEEAPGCPHPLEAVKVILAPSSGSFSAICLHCGGRWLRTDRDVPPAVMSAVFAAAGIAELSADDVAELGLYTIKVGDPYLPPSPLTEGLRWVITPSSVQCGVYWPRPTQQVVDGFHTEGAHFALTSGDHALMLSARFGHAFGRDVDWMDGSWQAACQHDHFVPGMAEPETGMHAVVHMILVDSTTGLIAGMRITTWPDRFHRAVHTAVQAQLDNHSPEAAGRREIQTWLDRYPNPALLVRRRAEFTCQGGAPTASPQPEWQLR